MRSGLLPFVLLAFALLVGGGARAADPAAQDETAANKDVAADGEREPEVDDLDPAAPALERDPDVEAPNSVPGEEAPALERDPDVEAPNSVWGEEEHAPLTDEGARASTENYAEPPADGEGVADPVRKKAAPPDLRGRDDADAVFIGIASGVASVSGLSAVAGTLFMSSYVVTNAFRLGGYTFTRRYWQWGVGFVVVPTLLALIAIPLGSVIGTWWGAGLRGLPLPLVDATAFMVIGLSLGTLGGAMIAGPPGGLAGGVVGTWMLATGALDYLTLTQGFNTAAAVAFLGAPAIGGVAAAVVGGTIGAALGPVLIASHWAGGAKASYFDEE